jgi:hypothetical protein
MQVAARFGLALTVLSCALPTSATTIDFDDLAIGTILSNQYAGVTFTPNALSGPGGPNGNWATNTDLTIVSATGGDTGNLGEPSLVSGNIVRSFDGWIGEDGDASLRISFAAPISSFSLTFAGVSNANNTQIFAYDGETLLGSMMGTSIGQLTLSYSAPSITSVIVTPGDLQDWVAFDNLTFSGAIPEPASWAMMIAGFGLVGAAMRRRVHRSERAV